MTGATGFVGRHVAGKLLSEGHTVRCLTRATSDLSRLDGLDVEIVRGDLTDAASLVPALDGCASVVHCAAMVSDWGLVGEIAAVNVGGTRALLEAAARSSVRRFVHISSTDVYGYPGLPRVDETFVGGRFRNWYARTKFVAEDEVRRAALETVILRPATVYGPGSTEVIGEMARAIRGGYMLMVGGGRAIAGLVYVENVADAVALALAAPAAVVAGEAFNVSDELPVTWRQFLSDLAAGLGARRVRWSIPYPVGVSLAVALEGGYRVARRLTGLRTDALLSRQAVHVLGIDQDFSARKAREVLGWAPRVDYERGLAATLEWLGSGA